MPLLDEPLTLPHAIDSRLAALRLAIRAYVWVEGLASLVAWLGVAFWLGLAIDWAWEPAWSVRRVALAVALAVGAWIVWRLIVRRAFVPLSNASLAMLLERRFTDLGDRLLTTVDWSEKPREQEAVHGELLWHTAGEAVDGVSRVELHRVFRWRPVAWRVAAAVVAVASLVTLAKGSPLTWRFWMERLAGSSEPWPRETRLYVDRFTTEFALVDDALFVYSGRVQIGDSAGEPDIVPAGGARSLSSSSAVEPRSVDALLPAGLFEQRPATPHDPPGLAVIQRAFNAVWQGDAAAFEPGKSLAAGEYRLEHGAVELVFVGGTRLALQGPATVQLVTSQRIAVDGGIDGGVALVQMPVRVAEFSVEHPRGTVTALRQNVLKVIRGADAELVVQADATRKLPAAVEVRYRSAAGGSGRTHLQQDSTAVPGRDEFQAYSHVFQNVLSSIEFDLVGGDDRVRGLVIEAVESPKLTSTRLACVFPDYLVDRASGRFTPREVEATGSVPLPEGTHVTLRGVANRAVTAVHVKTPQAEAPRVVTLPPGRDDPRAVEIDLGRLTQSMDVALTLVDADGLANREPIVLRLVAAPDEAPTVAVRVKGIGTAITPDAIIPIRGELKDDHALAAAWFLVRRGDASEKFPLARPVRGQAEQQFEVPPPPSTITTTTSTTTPAPPASNTPVEALDFRTLRQTNRYTLQPGDKLTFSVQASDAYNLSGGKHESEGDLRHLEVVTPDELLAGLESREFVQRQKLETIIDELTQTRGLLVDIGRDEEPQPPKTLTASATRGVAVVVERVAQNVERSAFETAALATALEDLRAELLNNRVDAPQHNERLDRQIVTPLRRIGRERYPVLVERVGALRKQVTLAEQVRTADPQKQPPPPAELAALPPRPQLITACQQQCDVILAELRAVLKDTHELEDYNKLVERLRSILKRQEEIQGRTIKKRREGLLE